MPSALKHDGRRVWFYNMIDSALLKWSKKLIACPSVTDCGTRALVELCAGELLGPAGIKARLIPSVRHGAEQVNLLAAVPGKRADLPALVFNTHLDTVAPGDPQLWTACDGDPFKPSISRGRIYGLGAADTKLDFAAKAMALIEEGKPSRAVHLFATFGEESGLLGARELADFGTLPARGLAFVGEPSSLALITANRGLNVFVLTVEGDAAPLADAHTPRLVSFIGASAHSSTPHLGRNAIERALRALAARPQLKVLELAGGDAVNKVPALCRILVAGAGVNSLAEEASLSGVASLNDLGTPHESDRRSEVVADNRVGETGEELPEGVSRRRETLAAETVPALLAFVEQLAQRVAEKSRAASESSGFELTYNAGVVQGAGPRVALKFELRQPPDISARDIAGFVEAIVETLRLKFPKLKFDLLKVRANPGFHATPASETISMAARAMAQAGLKVEMGAKAGCTEAGVYAAVGLEPVVFGPGPSTGVIHAPNEYNVVAEVEAAARFYRCLLRL